MKNLNHLKTFETYNLYNEGVGSGQIVMPEQVKAKLKAFATNNKELLKKFLSAFSQCKTQVDVENIIKGKAGVNEGFSASGVYDFLYKVFAGLGLSAGVIAFMSAVITAYQGLQQANNSVAISVLIVSGISAIIFYLISIVFDHLKNNADENGGGIKSGSANKPAQPTKPAQPSRQTQEL